ncbi:MAG: undecaprenyldiphospho-muramoylpentapeptide beta-N-acetylglucosaminyltransferase [Parcubacteria group bacterium]|nr:undecaprenyldiphospho-muramoylpentapeptide beta-N-acetylglucosaminyltransferase [Parcubacteria group bacterium]
MKIIFTGGGTGGHFYPIIAIAEQLLKITEKEKLIDIRMYYLAPVPYNKEMLFRHELSYRHVPAGKIRNYFSVSNFFDFFKTALGVLKALWTVYAIFPDVVIGKGGYASFPTLLAAKFLGIPVIIHESDSLPGKVNRWAGSFAKRVALSYPEAEKFFPKGIAAWTGNPIREEILTPIKHGAREFLKLEEDIPTILVLGGSQGAKHINETLIDTLPLLLEHYQVIHQTGVKNIDEVTGIAGIALEKNQYKTRYKPFAYLDTSALRMSAGIADLVISRAGSTIFEIAAWGIPSIIIPIPESVAHDQRENAFTYARTGACEVLEEENLSPHLLSATIENILNSQARKTKMREAALLFSKRDAAEKIAAEIIRIAQTHYNGQ